MSDPKELAVSIQVRNNLIRQRRTELGLSQRELCKASGLSLGVVSGFECFRMNPVGEHGWKDAAKKLAAFFGLRPEALWPESIRAIAIDNLTLSIALNVDQLAERPDKLFEKTETYRALKRALFVLTPRQHGLIEYRFGLHGNTDHTLQECAEKYGVSRERIRQIETKALRRLRTPGSKVKILGREIPEDSCSSCIYRNGPEACFPCGEVKVCEQCGKNLFGSEKIDHRYQCPKYVSPFNLQRDYSYEPELWEKPDGIRWRVTSTCESLRSVEVVDGGFDSIFTACNSANSVRIRYEESRNTLDKGHPWVTVTSVEPTTEEIGRQ